ncbi:MAG: phosphopantetheine-binding protein [Tissierellia bacterium]|nr:phosphopantetheine-binding protein [Tissierellia bacterium]
MVEQKIIEIIKGELGIDDFDLEADLVKEYEIDSIGLLDFIMTVEDEFEVEFEDDELSKIVTAKDIIELVEKKVG